MPATIDPVEARKFAVEVVCELRSAGFEAFWAGGCVRDQLLGYEPKDYDVATSAAPEQVRDVFGKRRTIAIGASFGVISVLGPRGAGHVEVATFRRDGGYSDGRRPDSVVFSTAEEDAQRRDFTINGLFFDPLAEQVIDYVGGVADLNREIVRAIRDPHERFAEDKLRMLRAVRFSITFGFTLEAETLAAIIKHAPDIRVVSAERIAAELRRMLAHVRRAEAMRLLLKSGLMEMIWPEAAHLAAGSPEAPPDAFAWHRALAVLDELSSPDFSVALAAVVRETAGASENEKAASVDELFRRWRLSNDEREITSWLLAHEETIRRAHELPWPTIQRILIAPHVEPLLQFSEAVAAVIDGKRDGIEFCRRKLALPATELDPPPLISGNDLKRAGLRPGPNFKELLEAVRDAQLNKQVVTLDEALAFVRAWLAEANNT